MYCELVCLVRKAKNRKCIPVESASIVKQRERNRRSGGARPASLFQVSYPLPPRAVPTGESTAESSQSQCEQHYAARLWNDRNVCRTSLVDGEEQVVAADRCLRVPQLLECRGSRKIIDVKPKIIGRWVELNNVRAETSTERETTYS